MAMNRKERRAQAKKATSAKGRQTGPTAAPIAALLSAAVQAHRIGRLGETAELCRRVLAADPTQADALQLLAILALGEKRPEEARKLLVTAVKSAPDRADIHNTLGSAWLALGNPEKAIDAFETAIGLMPEYVDAHANLGEALRRAGRRQEGEQALRRALALQPGNADTANKLGALLTELGRWDDSEEAFRSAIESQPNHIGAWLNLGAFFDHKCRIGEAIAAFEKVLTLSPGNVQALARLVRPYQTVCAWDKLSRAGEGLDQATDRLIAKGQTPLEDPFVNLSRQNDLTRNLGIARAWSKALEHGCGGVRLCKRRKAARDDVLTVGYLSSDFNDHAVGQLVGGLFALHDSSKFRTIALSTGVDDDSSPRHRVAEGCDRFIDLTGNTYQDAARRIFEERIDLLVDLNGYSHGTGLGVCAYRPAPVQLTWLGYPGTTGASFIDYLIADTIVIPPDLEWAYSEAIIRLPGCYLPAAAMEEPSNSGLTREDVGLPERAVVFCSFNQTYKIEPELFDAWGEILAAIPDSVLWLAAAAEEAQDALRSRLQNRGVDGKRLIFANRVPERGRHLERIGLADIALDTWTYGGHSTTIDALWAGVPTVTRLGTHFPSRVCASVLEAASLGDLIAGSAGSYVAKARELALDPTRRDRIRTHLTTQKGRLPLFDGERFARNLEAVYSRIWGRNIRNLPPVSFDL